MPGAQLPTEVILYEERLITRTGLDQVRVIAPTNRANFHFHLQQPPSLSKDSKWSLFLAD
jgi:hypothetical protein